MPLNTNRIDDAVLALLVLGLHDRNRAGKSVDRDAMNRLHAQGGLISDPLGKAKSVTCTEEGLKGAGVAAVVVRARVGRLISAPD